MSTELSGFRMNIFCISMKYYESGTWF